MKKLVISISCMLWSINIHCQSPNQGGTPQEKKYIYDVDGNSYLTVEIGSQTWMAENLRTTKFNDGTVIPKITTAVDWNEKSPKYCWYKNWESSFSEYGNLYNGFAVATNKLCPTGWHVPNKSDLWTLELFSSGNGGALKEAGFKHWKSPNSHATNSSGFSALGGGYRNYDGDFLAAKSFSYFWLLTGEGYGKTEAACLLRFDSQSITYEDHYDLRSGFSVRCLQD